jgi:cation transport ATPase
MYLNVVRDRLKYTNNPEQETIDKKKELQDEEIKKQQNAIIFAKLNEKYKQEENLKEYKMLKVAENHTKKILMITSGILIVFIILLIIFIILIINNSKIYWWLGLGISLIVIYIDFRILKEHYNYIKQ